MKFLNKYLTSLTIAIALLASCTKVEDLPSYSSGAAVTLSANKTAVTTLPADSNNVAISFTWSDPSFATAANNNKFVIQIDSAGRNFSKAVTKTVSNALTTSYTGKELNNILLGYGFAFNVAYNIEARIIASYGNNNDQKVSNVLRISATPYKVPPKIALPTSGKLFIVGGGTDFDWTNSSTVNAAEEFARVDETTWAGVFNLKSTSEFLILPVKGSWADKFAIANKFLAGVSAGGDFGFNLNDNFQTPAAAGNYLITLDFQLGKFTCVPYTGPQMPTNLFMVGGATPADWANPASGPTLQPMVRLNSVIWEMPSIALKASNEYLILPVAGSWANKYAVANKSLAGLAAGGDFGYNLNDNFPSPAVAGNYKVEVNFATAKFKTTKL